MKKIIISALVVFFAATLFSCQKEALQQPVTQPTIINATVSQWLGLSFREVWSTPTTRNFVFQSADHVVDPAISYNPVTDVALAYAKIPGNNNNLYYRIPGVISTSTQNLDLDFSLTPASFNVSIWNAGNHSLMPDAALFPSYRFRYIVILRTTYERLNIDWNNYYAVAAALNISL